MPRVTTNEGTWSLTVMSPLTSPTRRPSPSAAGTAMSIPKSGRSSAAVYPDSGMTAANERSISPAEMTKTVATAMIVMTVCWRTT